jgi:hypothetical protein
MSTQTIISLAILKVNWDEQRKDYLDNFVPIVAQCLQYRTEQVVSLPELQQDLRQKFGLKFPQNAIQTLVKRLHKRDFLRLDKNVYFKNEAKLASLDFTRVQQKVLRMHDALIERLRSFLKDKYEVAWSVGDAEAALQAYLEDKQVLILNAASQGSLIPKGSAPLLRTPD